MTKKATALPASAPSATGGERRSLSARINRLYGAILLLSLLGISALLALASLRGLQNEALSRQQTIVAKAAEQVSFFIEQRRVELSTFLLANNNDLAETASDLDGLLAAAPAFQEIIITDLEGDLIGGASRGAPILQNLFALRQSQWFQEAITGAPYLSTLQLSSTDEPYAILAQPVRTAGDISGIIAARIDMRTLWNVVRDIPVGETGQAYILDETGALIAHGEPELVLQGLNLSNRENLAPILNAPVGSSAVFQGFLGERVYGATANPASTNYVVVTELPAREAEAPLRETAVLLGGIILITLLAALGVGWLALKRLVTNPVAELVAAASEFGQGKLSSRTNVQSQDELGLLGNTFNFMANILQESLDTLEARVAQRTRDLDLAMGISRRISSLLDPEELVLLVSSEIERAFHFYQVHIYLFTENQEELVLAGGTGAGGKLLLPLGHRAKLGEGAVGFAVENSTAVFMPDVTRDNRWTFNSALPATVAEIALPITSGSRILGALDVQHDVAGELTAASVDLLQSIANQIAIGLQNARQLSEIETSRRRLDLVISGSNDGIWDWEITTNNTYFSPRWKAILGYADHELPSDQAEFANRLHPDDFDRIMQAMDDYLAGETASYEHEFRMMHKDGSYRWILGRARLERDQNGQPLRIAGSHSDITERKDVEETVRRQAAQLQAVTEINTLALSMSQSERMLPTIATHIAEKFGLYHAHIYLLEDEQLRLAAGAGEVGQQMVQEGHLIPLQRERSLVAQAARNAQAILVNDVAASPDHLPNPLLPDTRSELAVPLLLGNQVLGVLDVQSDQTDFFKEIDINIQSTLANQLAASMQSIRALEQAAESAARANALTRRLTRAGWQEFAAKAGKRLAFSYERQRMIDLLSVEGSDITAGATFVRPLQLHGEQIGAIALSEPRELPGEAREIVTAVAERLSEHLENLRLTQQTQDALSQTETLYAGSSMLVQASSPQEVLTAITTSTALQKLERASILLFDRPWDENPEEIEVRAVWSQPGVKVQAPPGTRFPLEQFPIIHLINRHSPAMLEDIASDENVGDDLRQLFAMLKINSLVGLPLTVGNLWFGIITAQSAAAIAPLTEEEMRQIRSLVEQAATVLRTMQLLAEIQNRADLEQTLREITARVYAAPTAEAVLRTAAMEANRLLGLETFAYVDTPTPTHDTGPLKEITQPGKNGAN